MKLRQTLLHFLIPCLLIALVPSAAFSEAVSFGINDFGPGANDCGSATTSILSYCDDFADVFEDAFDGAGWAQVEKYMNNAVDGRDWSDPGKQPGYGEDTNDPLGVDFADVAMLCSHGGHTHDSGGNYSYFLMGDDDAGEPCSPNTRDHIEVGNDTGDLEIAILGTCQSAHYDVWTDGGYFDVRDRDGSFNTWLGFHGNSYDSQKDTNRLEDYLDASFFNGLGDNWLDEMYRNPLGSNNSQCPTAVIFCENSGDCDTQYEWGGFSDRFKVSSGDTKSTSTYYYLGGCDPGGGGALPN